MNKPIPGTVGILVDESSGPLPFTEPDFCRKLCMIGRRYNMAIYIFCPTWVHSGKNLIPGFTYENGSWIKKMFPFPDIIYDRFFSRDNKHQRLKQRCLSLLTDNHPFVYLTRGLAGKWAVYQALCKSKEIAPYLPETIQYTGAIQLADWLSSHGGEAFLKPQHGTHGKRTLHVKITNMDDRLRVRGRSGNNTIFRRIFRNKADGFEWINKITGKRNYLLQQYLQLNSSQEEPFDIRVLMQKNQNGLWSLTGMAVRAGRRNSLTSNLHGGGTAYEVLPFLGRELGTTVSNELIHLITQLSERIPSYLESYFGRLAELGIDFGVDKEGKVWILEVNSKPGRSSFSQIGDMKSARRSIENPIHYARYLLLSRPRE
ncbi:YheC/YheD family endospore coat-associated protein [Paenibacillus segetis]|uniref:ATP-grasp domain-containing protein n=1 Tax=Paenibacillus segetis TaxID=1325360 RepID=A0ABQ1Y7A4_9BACL|nr:YheC/YheD family protein [Paenibacillus segetis]GGH14574.1 hypothetical protein GCM10008013_08310 [Paenibacillus segetis]